jgi:hypothetical protein
MAAAQPIGTLADVQNGKPHPESQSRARIGRRRIRPRTFVSFVNVSNGPYAKLISAIVPPPLGTLP